MQPPHESYNIISVCGAPGTLHLHRPRDATPRHAHTVCHPRTSHASVLTDHTLLTLSQPPTSTTTALVHHHLPRLAGGPSRRTALPEPLTCLAIAPSRTLLAAAAPSGRVYIWHLPSAVLLTAFSADIAEISALHFTDDGDALLVAAADASVAVFATAVVVDVTRSPTDDPPPIARLIAHTLPPSALAAGNAGASARAVSASPDRSLRVWHIASARCIATVALPAPPTALVLTQDEGTAFVGLVDGAVQAVPVATLPFGKTIASDTLPASRPAGQTAVSAIALSPTETELIVGFADGVIRILDSASLSVVHVYSKHGVSSPITVVKTLKEVLDCSEDSLPLQRARDDDLAETFAPIVSLGTSRESVVETVWREIEAAEEDVFGRWEDMAEDVPERDQEKNADNTGRESNAVEAGNLMAVELMAEVEMLRKRNKELQNAGKRLLQIVEQKDD